MAWYLKEGSKNPQQTLPTRIRVPDSQFPGGNRTYTSEAVLDHFTEAGYTEVSDPPTFDKSTHRLDWSDGAWVVSEKPPEADPVPPYVPDPTDGWRVRGEPDPADFESVEAWLEHVNG
tara:strand:- start:281 stop:634 length:354 start_codon:yes stop_codon:yes gene_type:complete